MAENFQIRDVFNADVITRLAKDIHAEWKAFPQKRFLNATIPHLSKQSFSERLRSISHALEEALPADFPQAVDILVRALPEPMHPSEYGSGSHFIIAPQTAFISRRGMDHFELSMNALREMTRRLTAEWDVRHFFEIYPDQTRRLLHQWAVDPDMHVRRLVSEGTRPYVPWGKKLTLVEKDPSLSMDLLEVLKNDPTEYVRRSVANHLNDLSKKHPELVLKTLKRWGKEHPEKEMEKLMRHASRTLIKQGHPKALALFGFHQGAKVAMTDLTCTPSIVRMGGNLNFSCQIISESNSVQKLVIDYIIYFFKSNGSQAPKVFKLKAIEMQPGETYLISKNHSFRPITTRKYYPGQHEVAIQVNGIILGKSSFILKK